MSATPHTLQEIEKQAEALDDAQQRLLACGPEVAELLDSAPRVLFVGCGSARNGAFAAAPVVAAGMSTDEVAGLVVTGIRENAAYIFTHPELGAIFEPRLQAIREALEASGGHSGDALVVDDLL